MCLSLTGLSSEFGKAERDEARAKKYTPRRRLADEKQWVLRVGSGKTGKRYRGMREGQFSENTAYYVFFKAQDGAFEAVPVAEWYNFNLQAKYKALTAEEAEVAFEKRDRIRNFSLVMKSMKGGGGDGGGEAAAAAAAADHKPSLSGGGGVKSEFRFRVTDQDDWPDDSDASSGDDDGGNSSDVKSDKNKGKKKKKRKGTSGKKRNGGSSKKEKKGEDDDYDSDPGEESDGKSLMNGRVTACELLLLLPCQRGTLTSGKWTTFRTRPPRRRRTRRGNRDGTRS